MKSKEKKTVTPHFGRFTKKPRKQYDLPKGRCDCRFCGNMFTPRKHCDFCGAYYKYL